MPTPFMHLRAAHRFLNDPAWPAALRDTLRTAAHLGAFLLGNVAPDARVSGGLSRAHTHFFEYKAQVEPHAVTHLLATHPELKTIQGAHQAFIGGYIAHLSMDVVWCEAMLFEHFYKQAWPSPETAFNMLHVLLCYLDARDYQQWDGTFAPALQNAQPDHWAAFLPDKDIQEWRDIVARQICAGCPSETVAVLGKRVRIQEDGLRAILDSPERLQAELWNHVPLALVAEVDEKMYQAMAAWVIKYMTEGF